MNLIYFQEEEVEQYTQQIEDLNQQVKTSTWNVDLNWGTALTTPLFTPEDATN